ncbi:VWA domain-containing protein [Collinsella aerofaciens]|uniref:Spy0128 family protein n=1 Tax=Collinsella aerofaciens TaxID=74426 RepID=UPI00189CC391|nr:FctA domain-containing protein [Collinsella aerofaciens]MDB1885236.1 VWA domain-containing protein [Collinsella aerofaciens]MDB1889109.1 VWA domain-containing protein [Collinsella aerofaciens]MDB1891026.1 VWA domain-containing protein [Collinsella aerofaciens]MDB1893034.1 VWA domain-containing protein [Collinsella aerofaciens]
MGKYTRGLLAVILAVVLVLPAAAFAMLPEANARSSAGMDGPTVSGPTVVDPDTTGRWEIWAAGHSGNKVTTQNVGRIWTDKTVEATGENEVSDFVTTLSAMSSTSNSTVTVTTPLDIVMVLDASGSMDDHMGGGDSPKRIEALKNAANSFIDTIAKQNESIEGVNRQHKVAVVKFAGKKSSNIGNSKYNDGGYSYNYTQVMKDLTDCSGGNVKALKDTIKKIDPAGATRADNGLELAKGITSGREDAKKIIVFFTDGTPTKQSNFDSEVANAAVTFAKDMKDSKATVYTIGIFSGADPAADPLKKGTSDVNKFMHAVSSNYPGATSYTSDKLGTRAENSDYYKSATNADELKKVFDDISKAITSEPPYPTEIDKGYDATKSGYITFTDELGDFMQVDSFTEVVINGAPFTKVSKTFNKETNTDTYEFDGRAKDLLITVQRAGDDNPQKGDIVTVSIPASLIPLSHFKTVDGKLSVDSVKPIQVKYASSVKKVALDNLFTPEKVTGLKDYIEHNTTVVDGAKTVNFYANKWAAGALGDTVATFEPADTNRYYYFQKQTPIYTDKACTQPAKGPALAGEVTYYYKDEFEEQGENDEAKPATDVIEFIGGDAAKFDGAIVPDENGNWVFTVGTARLAFIEELHTIKENNKTRTATDVLNPKWNNTSAKATATHVNSYLGNNGKISYKYDMTPVTVDTKDTEAGFGLTKVLEGRNWKAEDTFEFGLTPMDGAPMPESATAPVTASVTKDDLDDKGKAVIDFGTIEYKEPGTYVYKVSEKNAGTTVDGIAYSKNVAEITVTVTPNKKGELSADVQVAWSEAGETEFKNIYTAKPVESSVTDEIAVAKSLTGRDLAAGEFSFELAEIVDKEVKPVETVKNAADGKVTFSPIKYTEIGQHTYRLREVPGDAGNGITCDDTTYTIVTTIADNGKGQLVATHELKDAKDAKDVKSIEFKNVYTTNAAEASLAGKKSLQVPDGLTHADITGKFTFTVTGEEGAPMPASTSVHNDADGKVDFGKITFTLDDLNKALGEKSKKREHTFTYTVTESGEVAGVTNDAKLSRKVSFTVTDNGKGKLSVSRNPDGDAAFTFTNTYNVTPVESRVTDQIIANKVLTGRDLKAGEFSFELVEGDKVVAKGTNAADGKITMSAVKYDKPGTHTYTLREVNGGTTSKGITYSDAKYTIETTITDNGDGTLSATHELKSATPATFENTYSVTPTDADLDFDLSKVISGRDWTDGDEFSFTITAPEDAPLPDPATVTVSKKDAKDGIAAIKFGKIHYAAAGTYKYEIRENAGSTVGMTYDAHVATAEVTVTENGDGSLTANVTKKENGRFTNTYRTELNYTAAGGLWLSKYLDGRPMTEGQFTFTVTPADDASARALGLLPGANSFKSPAAAEATVGLIDILAGHEVIFTQADAGKTFTYTVAEKNDGQPGYTYDDAVRTVTIAIADDTAGTLTATTTVSGGPEGTHETIHKSGENKVEKALVPFHNSYSATTNTPGGTAAQVVATKTLTGRPMADGEFWFGIAYQGELVAYENLKPNIGGHVSFDTLHYDTKMLANLEAAGLASRTDKDGKLAWTINYTAYEDLFGLPNGVSATTWSFGFKVIVVDNGDGTLTATVDYGGVEPLFENVYGAEAVDAALTGTKKLQAAARLTPADITGKFTFTVTADEAGAPMPERTTTANDAAGNVDFGKIHFTLEDLNRALGVTDDATDKAEADEADEAEADEAEADEAEAEEADTDANADEPSDEPEPAAPTAPRSHTFTYAVTESGSAPGVTNDTNATRKVSYTVSDDGAGHLSVKREGDDGAAFTFTNTYGVAPTDSSVTDQVKTVKRLTGRDLAAGEFTFELLEDDVVVANGTNDANGTVTLSPIRYEAPGTHTYTLREACPNALGLYKGVTYDGTTYTVVTTVSDNGDGTLTATHKLEGTTESAGFTNKYHAMPTQVSIGAIKVLEGRELKKDEFSFKLVGEDIESTVTNDADGKINFDKFEYDEPGTHAYTISEVKGDEVGMTYDKSVFTVTVNVVDDGEGNLKANVAFTKGDKSVEGIVFNNTYKKPETPVPTPDPGTPKTVTNIVKTVKGFLPTTGDQQAAALLMAFVIAMAGVGALVWGIRKR